MEANFQEQLSVQGPHYGPEPCVSSGMKWIATLIIPLLFLGCQDEEMPLFIMEYTVDIPFFPETNTAKTLVVRDNQVRSLLDDKLAENNLKLEDVRSVRVRRASLFPLDHSLDYGLLRRIEVNIFELSDPDDILPIASLNPEINEGRGELLLLPGLPNVKPYLEQDFFGLDIGYSYKRPFQLNVNNTLRLELEAVGF